MQNSKNCLICKQPAICVCGCPRQCSECLNGHHWHVCQIHQRVAHGKPRHTIPKEYCTCEVLPNLTKQPPSPAVVHLAEIMETISTLEARFDIVGTALEQALAENKKLRQQLDELTKQ